MHDINQESEAYHEPHSEYKVYSLEACFKTKFHNSSFSSLSVARREILSMRSSSIFSFGLSLSTLCLASPSFNSLHNRASNSSSANTTCATGVHMIVARGSTEQPGEGIIGAVATQVQQSVAGSNSEALIYPATLTDYTFSESAGVAAMRSSIQSYVAICPSSKIALLGYSQVVIPLDGGEALTDTRPGRSSYR